ncbi:MAG: CPBP family intramembrane metalloprotease, partial [Firmicutes bacterium]|nr:CPBP family intramembrane metalloprotease [Bacillota bacterium]
TNIMGMDLISLLVQLIMAFVTGVVLGAVYLKTGDLIAVIIAHFLIDVLGGIFYGGGTTPYYFLAIMVVLWIFETVYGFLLVRKGIANN